MVACFGMLLNMTEAGKLAPFSMVYPNKRAAHLQTSLLFRFKKINEILIQQKFG